MVYIVFVTYSCNKNKVMEDVMPAIESIGHSSLYINDDAPDTAGHFRFIEKDAVFQIEMKVPGFKRKQLQLVLIGNTLLVEGNKKEKKSQQDNGHKERNEFCFKTIIDLPKEIESKRIKAFFKKHMLKLEMPKLRHSKVKPLRIAIQ